MSRINNKESDTLINTSSKFISDETLINKLEILKNTMYQGISEVERTYERNIIDPFLNLFDKLFFKIEDNTTWKKTEFSRQLNKKLGNLLGEFHQNLLCSLNGCTRPPSGVDFICKDKKIVAEIKNKHNTFNADSKTMSFDKIKNELKKKNRKNFKGYFVIIIPKNSKDFCKQFVVTSNKKNKTHYRKPQNNIYTINGEYFYEKITGSKNILKSIFFRIPNLLKKIDIKNKVIYEKIEKDKDFSNYLFKALGNNRFLF